MASINIFDDNWTNEEAYEWRIFFIPILSGISLVFCLFAQVLLYIFPRLRVFPRSILSWLNLYNLYYCAYQQIRWESRAPWHATVLKYSSISCRIFVFVDITAMTGQYICTTLLCLSLFLMIVRKVDLENKILYFWLFLGAATFPPILLAIPTVLVATKDVPGSCIIGDPITNLLVRSPYIVMLAFQLLFVSWTLKYIKSVYTLVQNSSTSNLPIKYIFVRFIATILGQMYNMLPAQYLLTFPEHGYTSAVFTRFALVSHMTGPTLDALIMIVGNAEFTSWLFMKLSWFSRHCTMPKTKRRDKEAAKNSCEEGREFESVSSNEEDQEMPTTSSHAAYTLEITSNQSDTLETSVSSEEIDRRLTDTTH
eukprot:Phypoly_transcript_07855.p1 GENE.Phypoly_transcript_07855~~Phypoly_transcript_07855.p1  ORF type:complete len:367 (+),score=23.69 Phypoly_transcript_07855:163-1263(+)